MTDTQSRKKLTRPFVPGPGQLKTITITQFHAMIEMKTSAEKLPSYKLLTFFICSLIILMMS
jgi:hypothetical protein